MSFGAQPLHAAGRHAHVAPDDVAADAPLRPRTVLLLLVMLPLFGQSFHYVKDLYPLWALSKAFPVLSLPLIFAMIRRPLLPMSRQTLLTFLWLLLAPSIAGSFYFNQDFFLGLTAEVKILPMLYFFSFSGLLLLLRPTLREMACAFLICGIATILTLVILWAVIPDSWYSGTYVIGTSPLFSADDRGHRIRMPMYFAMILAFYSYRRFLQTWHFKWLLYAALVFLLTIGVVKTRSMVVGLVMVFAINGFLAIPPWGRLVMLVAMPFAGLGLLSISYLGNMLHFDASSGFALRLETMQKAAAFLGYSPARWLFGVGTLSPLNTESLFSYFDHFFFLADITWLGILFEFGIIGATLILLYQIRGLMFGLRIRRAGDAPILGALFDYALYALLISYLYPLTLTPGESAVVFAVFAYVWRQRRMAAPAMAAA